jgi:hypothetical protein
MASQPPQFQRPDAVALVLACLAVPLHAQEPTNPREAMPERPTVATHAYTVALGIVELETGVQWQRPTPGAGLLSGPTLFKIGLGRNLQLDIAPGWAWVEQDGADQAWLSDMVVGVKWHLAEHLPILADFSVQPTLKIPTGSLSRGTGTGTTDVNILLISSRKVGPVSLDLNAGYTRRSGDGSNAPKDSTVWTVSAGTPIVGDLQWDAEIFGYPGTSGPAGYAPIVAFLTGPTFEVHPSVVLDAGVILNITGFGGTAIYAGVTWNMGRLPGHFAPISSARQANTAVGLPRQQANGGSGGVSARQ